MLDAVDTFWNAFITRLDTINPSRNKDSNGTTVGGIVMAQDFPPSPVVFDAFYLVVIADSPVGAKAYSQERPIYETLLQFTWINQGSDVDAASNMLGQNRGDRYRVNLQMKQELIQALYPGFTAKKRITGVNPEDGSVLWADTKSTLMWGQPTFRIRSDNSSGVMYSTATVRLTNFAEAIQA